MKTISRRRLVSLCIYVGLIAVLGLGVWLWEIDWHRSALVGIGAGLVAFLGPLPGLLTPEARERWLVLVFVSCLIGLGSWYSFERVEQEKREIEGDLAFEHRLLERVPTESKDAICLAAARPLQALLNGSHEYERIRREATELSALCPGNGHALYFFGEASRILGTEGDMLTGFKAYLFNADKHRAEADNGDADACYARPSGFCAERAAYVDHLLANYFFVRATRVNGQAKWQPLEEVVTHELSMQSRRDIGFHADETILDSVDLLRRTAAALKDAGGDPSAGQKLAEQIGAARAREVAGPER
jgi:hypothetical protein